MPPPPYEPRDPYEPAEDVFAELEPLDPEPDEENLGAGAPVPFALPPALPEVGVPAGLYVVPVGAVVGTGTAKGLFGAVAIFGADGLAIP